MEITVILSQENETLPKAELLARLGTLKIEYDIINEYPGVIELDVCADKEKIIELGSHLGYTHEILLTLDKTTPEELEDVIKKIDWKEQIQDSFKVRVKRMGKMVVHMGGSVQTLFGIKNGRKSKYFSKLYNEYWVYPSKEETPPGFMKVEGGCYWNNK